MKVTICFTLDNAAFEDDFHGEFARMLDQAKKKFFRQLQRTEALCTHDESDDVLLDVNGNLIGDVDIDGTWEEMNELKKRAFL